MSFAKQIFTPLVIHFKKSFFIHFCLRWVFVAVRRLTLVVESRELLSSCVHLLLIAGVSLVSKHKL